MMPKINGVEATRQILSGAPSVKILALSLHAERQWVEAMVKAGASGYVLKDDPSSDLPRAIRQVAAGETYFSSGLGSLGSR
jgi:DNA-binding NarL/FixJ family response regulator